MKKKDSYLQIPDKETGRFPTTSFQNGKNMQLIDAS